MGDREPAHHRPPVALAALLLATAPTGCSLGDPGDHRGSAAAPRSTTTAPTPLEVCARSVAYWSDEALSRPPDWGLDYQEMGGWPG